MRLKNRFYAKRSLFRKYMNVSVLLVFFSFFVLGTILTVSITNYWSAEKLRVLEVRAENVALYVRPYIAVNEPFNSRYHTTIKLNNPDEVRKFLSFFAGEVNGDITIANTSGQTQITVNVADTSYNFKRFDGESSADNPPDSKETSSDKSDSAKVSAEPEIPDDDEIGPVIEDESDHIPQNAVIPADVVATTINEGKYFERTTLNGIYKTEKYVAAYPIFYDENHINDHICGIVVVSTDTSDATKFTDMVLKLFILSAIAALGVSFLAISIFSYNLVKPLKQMALAAKQFAKGDFTVRVSETSNDEIGELAVSFNNMAESLSSAEVTRRSFIANVSHELKTPMTTIAGFIDGILDGTIPPDKNDYYLHIVSDEVKRLSRLVRSMLDLSRLDNGELKLNYKSFDLLSTLVTILITFEQEIDKKNIEIRGLDTISPKKIYGDKDLIHQIVYNLIENAVKFTDEGGYIQFDITENNTRTDFVIKNSGTGIKKSEIPLVFDKFYKTDKSRSKDKKGLGLGLYLVRSIIRLHGGDITADSVYGEYTEFRFYIPKKQEKGSRPA